MILWIVIAHLQDASETEQKKIAKALKTMDKGPGEGIPILPPHVPAEIKYQRMTVKVHCELF